MVGTPNISALLGNMGPGAGIKAPKGPRAPMPRVGIGSVPDQAPVMNKAKALLSGVPMAIRGRKPRLGGL